MHPTDDTSGYNILSVTGYGYYKNRINDLDDTGHLSLGHVTHLQSGVVGNAARVVAQLGSAKATASFTTKLENAATVSAVLVDSHIYRDL